GRGARAPPAGVGAEGGEPEGGGGKGPAWGGEGLVHAGRAEADDVGSAVPVHVRQLARVGIVAAPTAGVGPEGGKLERGHRKVPACGGLRLVDTGRAEGDDVGSGVRAYVRELARIGVVAAPTAGAGTAGSKLARGPPEVRRPS